MQRLPRIALKEIPVLKVCAINDNGYVMPYYVQGATIYWEGTTYHEIIWPLISATHYKGLHSFDPTIVHANYRQDGSVITVIGMGMLRMFDYNAVMVNATIPKGSIYFRNTHGEIVSNNLRIDKINHLSNN